MRLTTVAVASAAIIWGPAANAAPTNNDVGLAALGKGQYSVAIQAFTKALTADHLGDGLKEFAYSSRGKAHAALHHNKLAEADFKRALAIDPTDEGAQQGLAALGSVASTGAPQGPIAPSKIAPAPKNAWGPLTLLAGHHWLESGGSKGRWTQYTWETPGEVLAFHGMDEAGHAFAGQYRLDSSTGHITGLTADKGQPVQTDLSEVTGVSVVEESLQQGVRVRISTTYQRAGLFQRVVQAYVENTWKPVTNVNLVQTSPDVIATLGWKQAPEESGFVKLMKGLGGAFLEGAKAGLTDGLHEGLQAKTRHEIAPKQYPNAPQ